MGVEEISIEADGFITSNVNVTVDFGYVKDMGLPRFIGGYTCTYNAAKRICSVTAIPKGENRRAYFRRANEMVRDMIADEK